MKNNNINELKILLANKITSMFHGNEEAKKSENSKRNFLRNSSGSSLPSIQIDKSIFEKNINIIDLIILSKLENPKVRYED